MAGKREKKREDPMAVWLSTMCRLLKGGALAAATAALGLLVCALLVSGGVVGEKLMGRGVLAICVEQPGRRSVDGASPGAGHTAGWPGGGSHPVLAAADGGISPL